jgi:hypothetical protein
MLALLPGVLIDKPREYLTDRAENDILTLESGKSAVGLINNAAQQTEVPITLKNLKHLKGACPDPLFAGEGDPRVAVTSRQTNSHRVGS